MIRLFQQIIKFILGKHSSEGALSNYIARNTITLSLVECFSLMLGFLLNFILVKTVKLNDYGYYVDIFNLLNLLAGFCLLGADTLALKMTATYFAAQKREQLKGMIIFSIVLIVLCSIGIGLASTHFFPIINTLESKIQMSGLLFAVLVFILIAVTTISQSILQGLDQILISQLSEKLIRPLLMVLLISTLAYSGKQIGLGQLIWINVISLTLACFCSLVFLGFGVKSFLKNIRPKFEFSAWKRLAATFFLVNILYVINSRIDILLLGFFRNNSAVGIYNIALKLSGSVGFVLAIINFVIAPTIVKLHESRNAAELQKMITKSARISVILSTPLIILLLLLRKNILAFFGIDFLSGDTAFVILSAGQIFNVLVGSVGTLLLMSGHQKFSIYSLLGSIIFNIFCNVMLTPKYGINGTALSTALSMTLWNLMMYIFVRKKLGIRTTFLGIV